MNQAPEDDFDPFEARAPQRNPMDDVAKNTSDTAINVWNLQQEVSHLTSRVERQHAELLTAIYAANESAKNTQHAVERNSFVLWVIAGLLGAIGYYFK